MDQEQQPVRPVEHPRPAEPETPEDQTPQPEINPWAGQDRDIRIQDSISVADAPRPDQ